ncbi:MAG: NADP-dependent oxidoreductase [Tahibacter sp.]
MRRLQIVAYGPLRDAVQFADVGLPSMGVTDVLIRMVAAGINPIDYKIAAGALRRVHTLALPAAFGFDGSGIVEAVGASVRAFKAGDAVFVRAPRERMGSFAEYLATDQQFVAKAPFAIPLIEAASIPLVALTTVQGLVDRAQARPGQRILIHAGSGGLGSFAIQYAKRVLGLHVTTTTSSRNQAWVRELGADVVIAYDEQDYRALPARYDIVFDTLGGAATAASFDLLNPGGVVVSVAGPPDRHFARQVHAGPVLSAILWLMGARMRQRARAKNARYFRFLTESSGAQLESIARLLTAGTIKAVIDQVFPFERAIEALEYAAQGRAKGKVMLQIDKAT